MFRRDTHPWRQHSFPSEVLCYTSRSMLKYPAARGARRTAGPPSARPGPSGARTPTVRMFTAAHTARIAPPERQSIHAGQVSRSADANMFRGLLLSSQTIEMSVSQPLWFDGEVAMQRDCAGTSPTHSSKTRRPRAARCTPRPRSAVHHTYGGTGICSFRHRLLSAQNAVPQAYAMAGISSERCFSTSHKETQPS